MFRFTDTKPSRNPGLDNAIVLHERVYYQQPKGSPFPPIHHRYGGHPWTYGGLRTRTTTYAIGEVWASMLWEVYWNLVTKHGFATNLYDASQSAGNVVAMRIIIGGMTIHSCNPTLLGARDASLLLIIPTTRVPTSARSTRDLPSVALALGPPTPAQMTFRFHLNVSSDSAPVSYDDSSTSY
ncbi:hypothetical protein BASA83_010700 [Batrachochytrium salamandrivorans]|nr:hypothetical protein BASA83_010700 [Batrachochytrium salamandrivorans]